MEETVLECPTLVTDMKKKVKDIQMAISWRDFANTYFQTISKVSFLHLANVYIQTFLF